MTKVLMVISAADRWTLNDGTVHPSGYWAEEVARPHQIFTEAGWHITVATLGGKTPTLDKLSLGISGGMPWKRREVKSYLDSIANVLAHPVALRKAYLAEFARFLEAVRRGCREFSIDHVVLRTDEPLADALSRFLASREARSA